MNTFFCIQFGDSNQKRLVFASSRPSEEPEPVRQQQVGSNEPSALKQMAGGLDADALLTESGDNASTAEIISRLQQIQQMRKSGQTDELRKKIIEWYWNTPRYQAIINTAGGNVTSTVISQIRDAEVTRVRTLLSVEGQAEYDQITTGKVMPSFNMAYTYLTTHMGMTDTTSAQTRQIITDLNPAGPNSAVRYLELYRQKQSLEQRLAVAQSQLHEHQARLEIHRQSKAAIDKQKEDWDKKKWSWIAPLLKVTGITTGIGVVSSTLGGLGQGLWAASAVETGATLEAASGLWAGFSAIPKAIFSLASFKAASVLTGVGGLALAYHHAYHVPTLVRKIGHRFGERRIENEIESRKSDLGIDDYERQITEAEHTLQGYRQENAEKHQALNQQLQKYQIELGETDDPARQHQLETLIENLSSLMTLYRISEGNYADRITESGVVNNDYIVRNLRALGIDSNSGMMDQMMELTRREEDTRVKNRQKELQSISAEGRVEKELPNLSAPEETSVRHFLGDPTLAVPTRAHPELLRKAPRLVAALDHLHHLPLDNAWRETIRHALLQTMNETASTLASNSMLELLKLLENDDKKLANSIRSNPQIIVRYAPQAGLAHPAAPRTGETFSTWTKRLTITDLSIVSQTLEWLEGRNDQLKKIDKNFENIKDSQVKSLILSTPLRLQDVESRLPAPATLPGPPRNFDEYKERLDSTSRELLADTLLRINAPHQYVRNPNTDELEYKYYSDIESAFEALFNDETRTALNNTNITTLRGHLQAASNVLGFQRGQTYGFLNPSPVGTPADQVFITCVRNITDPNELKLVANLLERMRAKRCRFNPGSGAWTTR